MTCQWYKNKSQCHDRVDLSEFCMAQNQNPPDRCDAIQRNGAAKKKQRAQGENAAGLVNRHGTVFEKNLSCGNAHHANDAQQVNPNGHINYFGKMIDARVWRDSSL